MKRKYIKIYDDLVEKIEQKKWATNEMLPSENELAQIYETTRETVRKALNLLSQNGYIQKVQGKGSIILEVNKFSLPFSGIVSFKELVKKQNINSKTLVKELRYVDKNDPVHQILNSDEQRIWSTKRVREISGEKIILDKDYFLQKYVPLLSEEIVQDSIYEYIENELGLAISFARKEIVVESVTEEDKELLDVDGYSLIVVIKSLIYLEDANVFQYSESRHRADKFRFIDFARRVK